ncbi:Choline binding protein D [Streptococcus sp. DD10]|uniref:GBS Bsp-like repeat-containing protein n=1 Tax=Streptococcus sp. DD10 TaxID=1777878 RepID=UPI0007960BAA|nr:GBS Bsp-like repeat-containing protein [Streptococcus sp. DD10]KXT74737.1 Choline binding protein D [Streptococcus sp. DD10]
MNNTNKLNRFSIRKYSIGVASVLVGFAFLGTPVLADQVTSTDQEPALTVTVDVSKETVEIPTPEVVKEGAKAAKPEVEVVKSDPEVVAEASTVKLEVAVEKPSETTATEKTAVESPEAVVTTVDEKSTEATNLVTKKTVGYAASNIDKPETSIVNDVTRVRAVKKDGKYVRSTEVATPAENGHVALLATENGGAVGDDYPSYWRNPNATDSWGYNQANCTSFVAHRLHNINHFEVPRGLGNGGQWGASARNLGYRVDNIPTRGSVAYSTDGGYGHVAWVASVEGSRLLIEEYNWYTPRGMDYSYHTRYQNANEFTGFIHFKDIAGGASHTSTTPTPDPNQGTPSSGRYTFSSRASIKLEPKMSSPELAYYDAGQSVNYDRKLEADGHEWISYLSFSGNRRYIAIRETAKPQPTVVKGNINVRNMDVVNGSFDVVIDNVSSNKGLKTVSVPIWTENNGQDDIIWYTADQQSDGTYKVTVNSSKHKNERGLYNVHLYYVLNDGHLQGVGATQTTLGNRPQSEEQERLGTIRVENKNTGEFDVVVSDVYSPNGLKAVKLPTWSKIDGQDDIIWYTMSRQPDGTYRQHVKASDHKNSSGEYNIHLYYEQNDGTLKWGGGTTTNVQAGVAVPNIPSRGVYRFTGYAAIRPEPSMSSAELAHYDAGNMVNYDRVLTADGHAWISYIGFSGSRRYIAIN